jgi:hypothetical protein
MKFLHNLYINLYILFCGLVTPLDQLKRELGLNNDWEKENK